MIWDLTNEKLLFDLALCIKGILQKLRIKEGPDIRNLLKVVQVYSSNLGFIKFLFDKSFFYILNRILIQKITYFQISSLSRTTIDPGSYYVYLSVSYCKEIPLGDTLSNCDFLKTSTMFPYPKEVFSSNSGCLDFTMFNRPK